MKQFRQKWKSDYNFVCQMGRAIIMPNTIPPVVTTDQVLEAQNEKRNNPNHHFLLKAKIYMDEILKATPEGVRVS